jgi:hypothetical protein
MGDAESTVKRFYVRTLEPGVGKEGFELSHEVLAGPCTQVAEKQNNMHSPRPARLRS